VSQTAGVETATSMNPRDAATPTATAASPTIVPTPEEVLYDMLGMVGAVGWLCEPGQIGASDSEKLSILEFWNFSAELWATLVESVVTFQGSIPVPFIYETAIKSPTFKDAAAAHLEDLDREIARLVGRRAQGVAEPAYTMSLRMGDYFDLERVAVKNFSSAVTAGNRSAWNEGVVSLSRFGSYDAAARDAIDQTCAYLKGE